MTDDSKTDLWQEQYKIVKHQKKLFEAVTIFFIETKTWNTLDLVDVFWDATMPVEDDQLIRPLCKLTFELVESTTIHNVGRRLRRAITRVNNQLYQMKKKLPEGIAALATPKYQDFGRIVIHFEYEEIDE